MPLDEKLMKRMGVNLDDIRLPSFDAVLERYKDQLLSDYPVMEVGDSPEGYLDISEEERTTHVHIIGSPREGKSKLMEMMMCHDIRNLHEGKTKSGVCFIDSSDQGDTMYNILAYCKKIGFTKLFIIEPNDAFDIGYVPHLNPFAYSQEDGLLKYHATVDAMTGFMLDTLRVQWQTEDPSHESRINYYAPLLIDALYRSGNTLKEADVFSERLFAAQREEILNNPNVSVRAKLALQEAMRPGTKAVEFLSTVRRFASFFDSEIMSLLIGSQKTVSFNHLLGEGWVILCNLYPQGVFAEEKSRLIGTLVLNRIVRAMDRLIRYTRARADKKEQIYHTPYYIYIDEFGQYATKKIAEIMFLHGKSGLRLHLAHQDLSQVKNKEVLAALKSAAKIKVLFYTGSRTDRSDILNDMFAGPIRKDVIEFLAAQTEKQHAYVKKGKQAARKYKINDWASPDISPKELNEFKRHIYQLYPQLYSKREDVDKEIKARAKSQEPKLTGVPNIETGGHSKRRSNPKVAGSRSRDDAKPPRKTSPGSKRRKTPTVKDNVDAEGSSSPTDKRIRWDLLEYGQGAKSAPPPRKSNGKQSPNERRRSKE